MFGETTYFGSLAAPDRATGHHHTVHNFSGHDAAGDYDGCDGAETGSFTARLVAGIGVWALILLLML